MIIVIVGAGAAGMTAAIACARNNHKNKIYLLEHADRVGKKILATGNGKCNLTNSNMKSDFYRCDDISFVKNILSEFGYEETLGFFSELGIMFKNKDGYIYPYSGQAASVLDVLRMKCEALQVKTITEANIRNIKTGDKFIVSYTNGNNKSSSIEADRIIIATGSKASNIAGADASGYKLIKNMGYKIKTPLPALTGLKCSNKFCKSMSGVRCDGTARMFVDGEFIAEDTGEIQLTDYGISGIPIFQISRYASIALNQKKQVKVLIDFMPSVSEDTLLKIFNDKLKNCPEKNMEEQMIGILNKKVSAVMLKQSDNRIESLVHNIKNFEFNVTETNSFEQAQICCGGVDISQINHSTMESNIHKGLYFAGEIIDVDAICGGYNLQWAWSTGYIAGRNAAC